MIRVDLVVRPDHVVPGPPILGRGAGEVRAAVEDFRPARVGQPPLQAYEEVGRVGDDRAAEHAAELVLAVLRLVRPRLLGEKVRGGHRRGGAYSNHAIETTVTLGVVFGLASRQTEGFLRSLLTLLNLDNDVPDHTTISRRKARLGKVAFSEQRTVTPVHLLIDSSGLSVHVGQRRTPPNARDYRKLHLAVDEHTGDVVACELTSKRARDASRVASLVGQIERPIASATADAAYDTGDVYEALENHRADRSPKVLIPPRSGAPSPI